MWCFIPLACAWFLLSKVDFFPRILAAHHISVRTRKAVDSFMDALESVLCGFARNHFLFVMSISSFLLSLLCKRIPRLWFVNAHKIIIIKYFMTLTKLQTKSVGTVMGLLTSLSIKRCINCSQTLMVFMWRIYPQTWGRYNPVNVYFFSSCGYFRVRYHANFFSFGTIRYEILT